jgi:signal transduction histidine kinase
MSWRRPSLTKRLALSFLLSFLVLGAVMAAIGSMAMDTSHAGPARAAVRLAAALHVGADGGLVAETTPALVQIDQANPGFWAVAKSDRGRRLVRGRPPEFVVRMVDATPLTFTNSSALNFSVPGPEPTNLARMDLYETRAGVVLLAVGGVDPATLGPGPTAIYLRAVSLIVAVPVVVVLAVVLWLIVAPLMLKGIRPLAAAAAAIDGSEPSRRLPEQNVMAELLPIVRAFNGALDRLEEMLERRRRFMADAAHELRTPLAVLTAHVETLPAVAGKADLQRGVFRLTEMVGQMMDAERLHGPGGRREVMDLAAVVREAATEVTPLALAAGYDLSFEAEAEPTVITGDPHAVKRAVTNLLGNAVAHGGGSGEIRVRVTAGASVEVSDQGAGVSAAGRERVFEPFHRERWDRDGCGLGLYLVREIMRAHHGSAEILPSAQGARFRLSFPPTPLLNPGAAAARQTTVSMN